MGDNRCKNVLCEWLQLGNENFGSVYRRFFIEFMLLKGPETLHSGKQGNYILKSLYFVLMSSCYFFEIIEVENLFLNI